MKDTRRPGAEKADRLWKGFASGIKDRIKDIRNSISHKENEARDMGDTHTPVSRLDLTGLNREQAKELIAKIIDEKLAMISSMEIPEPEIDYKERERLRAEAEKRISKRRKRRKRRQLTSSAETIVTEHGVFSDYSRSSVFDVLQPEPFPFEEDSLAEEAAPVPIEGQLSILDVIEAEKTADDHAEVPESAGEAQTSGRYSAVWDKARQRLAVLLAELHEKWSLLSIKLGNFVKLLRKSDPVESDPAKIRSAEINHAEINHAEIDHAEIDHAKIDQAEIDLAEIDRDSDLFKPHSFDLFGIFPYETDQDIESPDRRVMQKDPAVLPVASIEASNEVIQAEEISTAAASMAASAEEVPVDTSLDEAVDKLFAFYENCRDRLLLLGRKISLKASHIVKERMLPAAAAGIRSVNGKLAPLLQRAESRLQLKHKTGILLAAVLEKEKLLSGKIVIFIDYADRVNEVFLRGMAAFRDRVCYCNDRVRDFAERHKKQLLVEFGVGVAVIAGITIYTGNATAYEYIYNGKVLGVVKNQDDVYKTIDVIGEKLSIQYDANIIIDKEKDIRFNKIVALDQDIDTPEDILNRLTYMRDMKANGKGIFVDGELVAVLESEKTAREILQNIQNEFLKTEPGIEYEKIGFAEDIAIRDVETKLGSIEDKDEVLEYLLTGAVEQKVHVVQSGETFSEIAKMYGIKQSELRETNPEVIPEKLHIGQEIRLNRIVPLVTVQTTEIAQYIEEIPFDIKYENTASLYKNEQTVKSRGVKGQKDVVAEIVRNNGIEVSRREISSTVISEPVSQVVLVGTKEPPPLIGTGTFIYPVRGTLTSRYGSRWGRLHAGIDLAAPIGTPIKAADGGKVTFAGYKGALGYMVEIDHGGGRVTWYGHCSKLLVKKGDKVYQGQHIANVGNTGRSTGPHLHFEVHINGKTKNPLNYL